MTRKAQLPTAAQALYAQVREVLARPRQQAHRGNNQAMVLAYWPLYLGLPGNEIRSTPWSELSWSHLRVLMRLADRVARQVSTLFHERLMLGTAPARQ